MDVATVVLAAGTALGGGGSLFLWLETRGEGARKKRNFEINHQVAGGLAPVLQDLHALHAKLDADSGHAAAVIKNVIHEALDPVKAELNTLSTKIEPLWKALEQLAINNANVLHHPVPERAELDTLLDHFRENVLTADEEFALRRYLVRIKNWETGQDLGFPVFEGEPSAAANLLSMLDLVRVYRKRKQ